MMTQRPRYAFDGEDTILWDLVGPRLEGFFIDVGANDPVEGCVSKSFYDAGWRGVNIEPLPLRIAKFAFHQPLSVNLPVALSDKVDPYPWVLYNSLENDHWATLDPGVAARKSMVPSGVVRVDTLANVCAAHAPEVIDWLKIDVEGWEDHVLRGNDWAKYRPRFLCIESFEPHQYPKASWPTWEPFVLDQDYRFVGEHLLNRFYERTA